LDFILSLAHTRPHTRDRAGMSKKRMNHHFSNQIFNQSNPTNPTNQIQIFSNDNSKNPISKYKILVGLVGLVG
jgi:hypothetical protein